MADRGGLDKGGILALVFGGIAWMTFLVAIFVADDPFFYLLFALACGGASFAFARHARREEAAAIAAGATAAGAVLLYGVTIMAALTAMVYAMGVLLFVALLLFLAAMFSGPSSSSGSSGGCDCGSCDCGSCDCGTCDCGTCDCGGCGGCGDCGGAGCGDCGGGCGGCGCIGFGAMFVHAQARLPWRARLAHVRTRGLPHHPDLPEYAQDVFLVRGARWCVGCFTTYPVFLVAMAILIAWPLGWMTSLLLGAVLACAQLVSSAGLAKRRLVKVLVKGSLGVGLALLVSGVHQAPWPPAVKLASLLALLGLAWLSAVPRARRMAKHHEGCACGAASRDAP